MSAAGASAPIPIMVNDLTGKMGRAVADAVVARGSDACVLVPVAFSGDAKDPVDVSGVVVEVKSIRDDPAPYSRASRPSTPASSSSTIPSPPPSTPTPTCTSRTASLSSWAPPAAIATNSSPTSPPPVTTPSLAPQMGKQVVAFQAAMRLMAENFPGAFKGYTLTVTESHQASKVDTSGTAKAIVQSFNDLGCDFDIADAELVRDVPTQLGRMGVPEEHLLGHAYHTYRLVSPDGSVSFEFQHNVCGRAISRRAPSTPPRSSPRKSPRGKGEKTVYSDQTYSPGGRMITN